MSHALSGLEPKLLWDHFAALAAIPRGSKNESAATAHVAAFAARLGLPVKVDSVGNVLVTKPGTKGLENRPAVVLQGHLDMVCEKNSGTVHDFTKDPIRLVVDGDEVKADGTTLGADNGIGCAMGLAVADEPKLTHGPIEVLHQLARAAQALQMGKVENVHRHVPEERVGHHVVGVVVKKLQGLRERLEDLLQVWMCKLAVVRQ